MKLRLEVIHSMALNQLVPRRRKKRRKRRIKRIKRRAKRKRNIIRDGTTLTINIQRLKKRSPIKSHPVTKDLNDLRRPRGFTTRIQVT